MKNLRTVLILFVSSLLMAGCATVNIQMPAAAQGEQVVTGRGTGPQVILAPAKDSRASNDAGALGIKGAPLPLGANVEVGSDLGNYVTGAIAKGLVAGGFRVDRLTQPTAGAEVQASGNTVVVTIQSASLSTADAILFPADSYVSFAVQVHSPSGAVIFAQTYNGEASEHLGVHGVGGYEVSAGKVLAKAVDQAVAKVLQDQAFVQALRK